MTPLYNASEVAKEKTLSQLYYTQRILRDVCHAGCREDRKKLKGGKKVIHQ